MNARCLFGHQWHEVGRSRYIDVSFGMSNPETEFRMRCHRCGKRKTTRRSGHWEDGE